MQDRRSDMQIYYATRDGQARKIAGHIAQRVAAQGIAATPCDLASAPPTPESLAQAALVVGVLAVRYGRHLAPSDRLIEAYRACPAPPPLVLASVNLTARKPGKDTAEGNAYIRKFIERNQLTPALAAAFAGKLDYPRYRFFDRQIIRFIMLLTGGPTDPAASVEYTSWNAVDAFADKIAELYRGRRP